MHDAKSLIIEYLAALSGRPKEQNSVRQYVSDEGLAKHIAEVEAAFPRYEILTEDILADGDKVVVRGEFRGVHRGNFAGVQPTGKSVSAGLIIIYVVEDGRIVNHWMQFDLFSLMEQLRAAPVSQTA
ncbi:MAG TPA: ester cyclase [Bryobacteraceae bacterium]|nr:ester cyclase [Bryobacteraceae bacterium]